MADESVFEERAAAKGRNDAFMQALVDATTHNPFCRRERVWNLRAAFEVEEFDGSIHLGCIRSFERTRGDGSAALDWFCNLADTHGVTIRGTIKPCGNTKPRLTAAQLRKWYKRHGFTVKNGNIWRKPDTEGSVAAEGELRDELGAIRRITTIGAEGSHTDRQRESRRRSSRSRAREAG